MLRKRILIVGGVAAGASCAARARRLDEDAEIVIFERGPYVSFASCGLPYHVGDVIPDESALLLVTPERFRERFDIDVRVRHEVLDVDREARTVAVRNLETGVETIERYDALVLATGSRAIRPDVPGVDRPGVFTVRTVPDTRRLRRWIDEHGARRAVVVGAGFIGLEVAENLTHRGLAVTVVERAPQILAALDPEMAHPVKVHLEEHGLRVRLGAELRAIESGAVGALRVRMGEGEPIEADLVVLALGVLPETTLARRAGLAIGRAGGVVVDDSMRTSDPRVWAAGDAVETRCVVTGEPRVLALAGPASRQGRVAADSIAGRVARFRGVQGTVVCGLFGIAAAATGMSARSLRAAGIPHRRIWLHPKNHVGYYPGAETIHLELLYSPDDGRILGAQAVGPPDVDKRVDVIAMAIQMGGTVFDLEEAELCYAPQFGAAKDPVNVAGMIAGNQLRGDLALASWDEVERPEVLVIDVRERDELSAGHVPGALNVPLSELRSRLDELPRDRELLVYCETGKRSYDAARALVQHGFRVRNLEGGMESYRHLADADEGSIEG